MLVLKAGVLDDNIELTNLEDILLDLDGEFLDGLVKDDEAVVVDRIGCTLLQNSVLFLYF